MKKILFVILFFTFYQYSYAQIFAKTSNGRNVILNMDGTWKYADNESEEDNKSGCATSHTGNITVVNNNKNDIYFYYSPYDNILSGLKMVKVKSGTTKLIKDVALSGGRAGGGMFEWKAVLEMTNGSTPIKRMQGIANGTFVVVQCENKEVEIDD
jgi:hypothetical protein